MFLLRAARAGGREVLLQLRRGTGYMGEHWAAGVAGHVERGMQRSGGTGDPIDERVDYFFTGVGWSGTPRILEPDRCAELRWFDLEALPTSPLPVVPHELQVLESIRAGSSPAFVAHGF